MKRFYVTLGGLAVVGAAGVMYLVGRGPGGASSAAVSAPIAVVDDGFRGYTVGADSAPVEVTEYADFECPACKQFALVQMPTITEQLVTTGKVRWRFRDYPLPMHPYARFASHAAQCAGEQNRFWEMHDQLFLNHSWAQTGRNPAALFRQMAQAAGVDLAVWDACQASGRYAARIEFARQEGEQRGVNGTPTFFINGQLFERSTSDGFKAAVDALIARRP